MSFVFARFILQWVFLSCKAQNTNSEKSSDMMSSSLRHRTDKQDHVNQELWCPTPSGWWALAFPINKIGWRGPANCRTGSPAWCLRLPVAWASLWAISSLLSNSWICCSVHHKSLNTKLWRQTSERYRIWFKTLSLLWKYLRQMGQNNKSPR